eukprot:UN20158
MLRVASICKLLSRVSTKCYFEDCYVTIVIFDKNCKSTYR